MDKLRIGIVGTGMMGCEHIRNVMSNSECTVTAIADSNDEPLGWARLTLGDAADGVAEFRHHGDLLSSGLVDAVIVASPNHTHHGVLTDILSTDIPVLVEKPMCTTVEDCVDIVRAARSRDALTWVGLEYRYMAPIAALLDVIHGGELGELKMLTVREHRFPFLVKVDNWNRFSRNTGGTLVEKCCHFFDLMNLAIRSRPVRVMASGGQDVNHLDEWYDGQRSDILDNAYVIVEYDNGVRAMLDLSMFAEAGRNEQEIVAVGDRGKAEAFVPGDGHVYVGHRDTRDIHTVPVAVSKDVNYTGAHHGASYVEVMRFCRAVREKSRPEVTVEDGLWSVVIGAAAHKSIDEQRPVQISEYALD